MYTWGLIEDFHFFGFPEENQDQRFFFLACLSSSSLAAGMTEADLVLSCVSSTCCLLSNFDINSCWSQSSSSSLGIEYLW